MLSYILRRSLLAIPTLLLVTTLVFTMVRMVPGDVIDTIIGDSLASEPSKDVAMLKAELGLDKPLHVQYWNFITGIVTRGDLGVTLRNRQPVLGEIARRMPVTLELAIMAQILALIIAIPIGIISAIRQDTFLDYCFRSLAIANISIPSFWIATMVITATAVWLRWIPPTVYVAPWENPIENLKMFFIPALILGMVLAGRVMRMTRTMMLEVMRHDYIRTAWSKGLTERAVIYRHALKNALIPVITVVGLEVVGLIGGSVVLESIFSLPGMGSYFVNALRLRDYPIIQGVNVIVAAWVVIVNLTVDLSYAFLDPRIRYR